MKGRLVTSIEPLEYFIEAIGLSYPVAVLSNNGRCAMTVTKNLRRTPLQQARYRRYIQLWMRTSVSLDFELMVDIPYQHISSAFKQRMEEIR